MQYNMARKKAALNEMYKILEENNIEIALIQEPYTFNNIIPNSFPYTILSCNPEIGRPRACIILTSQLKYIYHINYATTDICVCTINLNKKHIVLVSLYLPPRAYLSDLNPINEHINILLDIINNLGNNIIVCGDVNAHNVLWGSNRTDARGEDLAELIASNDLHLLNYGTEPTFYTVRDGVEYKSVIDITLSSTSMLPLLMDWRVTDEAECSDHKAIMFDLLVHRTIISPPRTRRYITNKTNWSRFEFQVHNYKDKWSQALMKISNNGDVDEVANMIFDDLSLICQLTLPEKKLKNRSVPWWTQELSELRSIARRWKRKMERVTTPMLRAEYHYSWLQHHIKYQEAIMNAKRTSWRKYLSEQTPETAWTKIYRLCKNFKVQPTSTILLDDGTYTRNEHSTATCLLKQFFPDDNPETDSPDHEYIRICAQQDYNSIDDVPFTECEVAQIVNDQSDRKAPGNDGLTANIMKRFFGVAPHVLTTFYNACLKYGVFPKRFKYAIVRAIPKSAINVTCSKAWRPISLLPLPGKILEKLLIQRLSHNLHTRDLMSKNQYGFTKNKSTIDAIKRVVDFIRDTQRLNDFCAVVAIDVKSAFDSASWPAILYRLKKMRTPRNLWYLLKNYFQHRKARLDFGGASVEKVVTRGCPQGSSCGPGLWNILYDNILTIKLPYTCEMIAFADDLVLLSRAPDIATLESRVNTALSLIVEQSNVIKITFNEAKTQAMLCTRRRQWQNPVFIMNEKRINIVDSIKYLGVIIDKKLSWHKHLTELNIKINKIQSKIASIAHNLWGISTDVTESIYQGAIEPAILYGVDVWGEALRFKWARMLLVKMQRIMLLRICKAYRTTSNESLCVMANILPLPLKAEMIIQMKNVYNVGKFYPDGNPGIEIELPDKTSYHPSITNNTTIITTEINLPLDGYCIFTDGSKLEGLVGSAYVVYEKNVEIFYGQSRLPEYCSVFQAELWAIKMSLECSITKNYNKVTIFSDSLSALLAIKDRRNSNKLVIYVQQQLDKLLHVSLNWIKVHVGTIGNERADSLAKDCTYAQLINLPAPRSFVRRCLLEQAKEKWETHWSTTVKGNLTKQFFPNIQSRTKTGDINHNFVLTQFISGHGKFGDYLFKFKHRTSDACRCGLSQTRNHLLLDCPIWSNKRHELQMLYGPMELKNLTIWIKRTEFIEFIEGIHKELCQWERN